MSETAQEFLEKEILPGHPGRGEKMDAAVEELRGLLIKKPLGVA